MDQALQYFNLALGWFEGLSLGGQAALGFGLLIGFFILTGRGGGSRSSDRHPYRKSYMDGYDDISKFKDVTYKPCLLMSPTETRFYQLLHQAVPGYHIFPQVAINALVDIESNNKDHFRQVLRAFNTFRADFVICDSSLKVLAIVELDDKSHDNRRDKDQKRDYVTTRAGYRTVRFDCRNWPAVERIKAAILG